MFGFSSARRKPGWLAILPQGGWVTLAHVVREPTSRPEVRLLSVCVRPGSLNPMPVRH